MGLGELLDGAFKLLRADFGPMLIAVGVIVIPAQILLTIIGGNFTTDILAQVEQNPEAVGPVLDDLQAALPGFLAVTLLSTILLLLAEAAVVRIGAARYLGGSEGAGDALRAAGRKALPLVGARLLATIGAALPPLVGLAVAAYAFAAGNDTLGIIGLLLLFALALFAVYIYIRWYLTTPAVMLEDAGVLAALRRSGQLVKGQWWRVFGYIIVASIIVGLVGFAVSGLFGALGNAFPTEWYGWVFIGLSSILASLVTEPVTALIVLLLYADARIRKEGLDLQLQTPQWGASPG
jgi:Membrane domain of glycerophosphoryl diester phosphodiesterase